MRWLNRVQMFLVMAIVGAGALLSVTARTLAQIDLSAGLESAMQQDFLRRDLAEMQSGLKLDDSQVPILESFFRDYEEAFKTGVESIRKQLAQLRPALDVNDPELDEQRNNIRDRVTQLVEDARKMRENMPDGMSEAELQRQLRAKAEALHEQLKALQGEPLTPETMRRVLEASAAKIEQWQKQKAQLRDQFVANLKTVLSPQQAAGWPALEQKFTREKTLGLGRLSGESVDLFSLVREAHLPSDSGKQIESDLQSYSVQLNEALLRRNDFLIASQQKLLQAIQTDDRPLAESTVDRELQLRSAVRQVNDDFAKVLASKLPADEGRKFINSYRERGYSRVFRTTNAQRMMNSAIEMQGLDAATVQSLKSLRDSYLTEVAGINEQLLGIVRTGEAEEFKSRALRRWDKTEAQSQPAENAPSAIQLAFARRQELEARYVRQLEGLLTPEQLRAIPENYRMAGNANGIRE